MAMYFLADHVTRPEGMWRCVRWTCWGAQYYTGTDGLSQGPKQHGGQEGGNERPTELRDGMGGARTVKAEKKREV